MGIWGMQCPAHPLVSHKRFQTRVRCVSRAPDLSASNGRDATLTKSIVPGMELPLPFSQWLDQS
jgi:hypothetical protein